MAVENVENKNSEAKKTECEDEFMTPNLKKLDKFVAISELVLLIIVFAIRHDATLFLIVNEMMKLSELYNTIIVPYACFKFAIVIGLGAAVHQKKFYKLALPYIAFKFLVTAMYSLLSLTAFVVMSGQCISGSFPIEAFYGFVICLMIFNLFQHICLTVAFHVIKYQLLEDFHSSENKIDSPV